MAGIENRETDKLERTVEKENDEEKIEYYFNNGNYSMAIDTAKKIKNFYMDPNTKTSMHKKALICYKLGILYSESKNLAKAEEAYKDALAIMKDMSEESRSIHENDIADIYNYLAEICSQNSERYSEAVEYYLRAVAIYKQSFGSRQPDGDLAAGLCESYIGLGNIYDWMHKYELAEEFYCKALELKDILEKSSPGFYGGTFAEIYFRLGNVYMEKKQYEKAEKMYLPAIEILLSVINDNEKRYGFLLAGAYENLGCAYSFLNRTEEACKMNEKQIETSKRYKW